MASTGSTADLSSRLDVSSISSEEINAETDTGRIEYDDRSDWSPPKSKITISLTEGKAYNAIAKDQIIFCATMDEILERLAAIDRTMIDFRSFIAAQQYRAKPVYQCNNRATYEKIFGDVKALDTLTERLEKIPKTHISRGLAVIYRDRAAQFATSVSDSSCLALGIMNEKTERRLSELLSSSVDTEDNGASSEFLLEECDKMLELSTHTTNQVYATMNILNKMLDAADSRKETTTVVVSSNKTSSNNSPPAPSSFIVFFAIVAIISILLSATSISMIFEYERRGYVKMPYELPPPTESQYRSDYKAVLKKLHEMDERSKAATAAINRRIDNIEGFLGNADLLWNETIEEIPVADQKPIHNRLEQNARQLDRIQKQMYQMNRNFHNIDIRLTKRVGKLEKKLGWT